jgi:dolichyl-diphosphooligosaccharide--protein glycosyltransferase/undecaprenyl-diphosphooligosaccharide--protein glycosyltransferase
MRKSEEEKQARFLLFLWMALAYLFSLAVRYIWVDWASGIPEFYWNGQLMINTNDGYYFASAAQRELYGTLQHNPGVPDLWYTATITFTYFAAKVLPISLDTVILYMPAVISSLVVIPIILIGRLYGMTAMGFFAALLGSVTWSYYNRTMTGYYDTDMFSAMAPMFIVYFLMAANHRRSLDYALAAALSLILYPYLYNQGKAMVFAISVLYIAYVWTVHRKEPFAYPAIAVVAAAMLPLWWPLKLLVVLGVYGLMRSGKLDGKQSMYLAMGLTLVYLVAGDGFNFAYHKILRYVARENSTTGLHFYNVVQTIREAGHIPFEILAKRISGSVPGFFLALIGYGLLLWRHRAFVITLPLMGLGLFAWWGGLRFTVYAVPVAAMGLVYLFYYGASFLGDRRWQLGLTAVLTAAFLYPNITHIIGYKVPTVFKASEVKVLDTLKKKGSDKDYVIAWWDYGYPIWYYGNKNTLIDGGKHQNDNFIVSEILTTDSQLEAARLSRIAVETYVASGYKTVADTLFKNRKPDQIDPALYLENLRVAERVELPTKTREVYLFLPWRMSAIFPTVRVFSERDLASGRPLPKSTYYTLRYRGKKGSRLILESGVSFDLKKGEVTLGGRKVPIRRFVTVELLRNGEAAVKSENLHRGAPLNLLYLKSYNRFILLDERMFNSTYVQMFFLRRYDSKLFEPVVRSPWAMVYRIKI